MKTIQINGVDHSVNDRIAEFTINQKASSNVDFFGTDLINDKLFIQFKNGSSYIYSGVNADTIKLAHSAESIGKFVVSQVVGKFESEKIAERLVKLETLFTEEDKSIVDEINDQIDARINRKGQSSDVIITEIFEEPEF